MFDRSAHRKQVAGIIAHSAGGEVLLKFLGKGVAFPATIMRDQPKPTQANPDVGAKALEIVTIARDVRTAAGALIFSGALPREGQHFTDREGRIYRIEDDRTVSHSATLVFACATAAPSP